MKALCLLTDEQVKKFSDELWALQVEMEERSMFVRRQLEQEADKTKKRAELIWDGLRVLLQSRGMLPADYSDTKYSFSFDRDVGVLLLAERTEDRPSGIRALLNHMGIDI